MGNDVASIAAQLEQACAVIQQRLRTPPLAIHLYGSVLAGGLQPASDIDLLVTTAAPIEADVRQALLTGLLTVSAPPGWSPTLRALEVTLVVRDEVVPWRYPARRELQFGEWLRDELEAGRVDAPVADPDLAVLLTKLRQHSVALLGPDAAALLDPVPPADLRKALADTVTLWNEPSDWAGDERNIVLTLARIHYSAVTGEIASKAAAADWLLARIPRQFHGVVMAARQAYLGQGDDRLGSQGNAVAAYVGFMKTQIGAELQRG